MQYIEIENFFENPKSILEVSKNLEFFTFDKHPNSSIVGKYAGKRTLQLHEVCPELFESLCYGVVSQIVDFSKVKDCNWRISTYFSLINTEDDTSEIQIIHKDTGVLYAGVIYLNENPDQNSGTSLYREDNNQYNLIYEFDNKFNKMIMYDASIPHGITKFSDSRLCLLFFIKELIIEQ